MPHLPARLLRELMQIKNRKKTNLFANPFTQGGLQKPFVPAEPFNLPPFPKLPDKHTASPAAQDLDATEDSEAWNDEEDAEAVGLATKTDCPTVLFAGDERGRLHLLYGGSILLGSLSFGEKTDIISAFICGPPSTTRQQSPFNSRSQCSTTVSLLVSVPHANAHDSNIPPTLLETLGLPQRLPPTAKGRRQSPIVQEQQEESAEQSVLRLIVEIASFPSPELSLLSRAATGIASILSHAFEAIDAARQAWEEAQDLGGKWVGRLKDDDDGVTEVKSPELKLLLLLLTGRPANTDMHEMFANKNSERVGSVFLEYRACFDCCCRALSDGRQSR